jgi:DNA-binding NarL/FixJ family response regulator
MNGKIWTQDEVALLTSMVSQGCSYIDIAQKLGRTIHTFICQVMEVI